MSRKANFFDKVLAILMIFTIVFSHGNVAVFASEIIESFTENETTAETASETVEEDYSLGDQNDSLPDETSTEEVPASEEPSVEEEQLVAEDSTDEFNEEASTAEGTEEYTLDEAESTAEDGDSEETDSPEEPIESEDAEAEQSIEENAEPAEEENAAEQSQEDEQSVDSAESENTDLENAAESDDADESDMVPEENAEADAEIPAISYPAVSFRLGSAVGIVVDVDAPAGAFPEGTVMSVVPVYSRALLDAAAEAAGDSDARVTAVDITFWYEDTEIEPLLPISVRLTSSKIAQADEAKIVHIDDAGDASVIKNAEIEGATAEFSSGEFSVYAVVESVVPRLTITFMNGNSEIAKMYVKAADTADEVEKIVYDPGAGTLPAGQVFKGWTTDPNYTKDTELITIATIRSNAMSTADGLTGDDSVTYYAAIFKQYTITYVDGKGVTVGSEVVELPSHQTEASYKVNQGYSTDDTHNFEGWIVADGSTNINGYPGNANSTTLNGETVYYYENGDVLTITGDVKFSVSAPEGHWLVFDENGKGATYNAPRFIKAGQTTSDEGMLEMVRNGYTFDGWYTGAPSQTGGDPTGTRFQFGGTISETTTIYAKWVPVTSAHYTVIIWKQNVSGTGYDFAEAINLSGRVGSTINTVVQNGSNVNTGTTPAQTRNVRVDGTEKSYIGFHCASFDTGKTIVAEGSTVLNVYYDRNTITINFDAGNNRYILDENDNTYKRNVTYTGLYEAPLTFTWPTTYYYRSGYQWSGYSYNSAGNTLWQYDSGTTLSFVGSFKLPNPSSVTISMTRSDAGSHPRRFIQQNIDGTWPDTAHETINMDGTSFTITDKYTGFYAYQYRRHSSSSTSTTGWGSWHDLGEPDNNGDYTTVSSAYQLEIRFARVKGKITYMDGAYVDGNNNPTETPTYQHLTDSAEMYYGTDVTSYGKGKANYYIPQDAPEGYVFEGWFADKNCTQEYSFTTMPAEGITVYAKWRQIQYRVFLHPNAGTDPTLNWGSDSQEMNFRVTYGGKISVPEGLRTGYEFYGWYTDEDCSKAFTASTVLNDSTVTTAYDKTTHMTDPMDKWGNGATTNGDVNRFWITKEFNLYAKWSEVIVGADGIGIIYDVNGGSNAPSDTALYKDNTKVSAGAAATPPAKKVFDHWVVQRWNGSAFVDTDVTVTPGETFTALKSNARITNAGTETVVNPSDVVQGGNYDYRIQLKAVYKDKEEETPTHIDWYSNYGSENGGKGTLYRSNTGISINEAVPIYSPAPTRTGYTFKGWTKRQGGTTADFLIYTGSGYTTAEGKTVTHVAADEKQPYEDLFAVWEESEVTINYAVASDSTGMGTVSPESETVKVESGNPVGSTATAVSVSYVFDYWTVDDGTESISTDAKYTPSKNNGLYEAHTYYAHFKLNVADVTVHHYLKGTTTKVSDDVIETKTVGTEYTATPVTTYQGKTLTVDSYDPSQKVTVSANGNVITIYYTIPLTITAKTDSKKYDGSALDGEFTVEGALDSDKNTITSALGVAPSITNVSESPRTYQASTTGIPSYYTVTNNPGTLTIAKRTVTLTSETAEKPYDGTPLTKPDVTVGGEGFVEGEVSDIKATGKVTTVAEGEVTNTIVYTTGENFKADNYDITKDEGTLKITASEGALVIESSTKSWTYDGQTHKDEVYTVTYNGTAATADSTGKVFTLSTGDTVTITATAEGVKDYSESYSKNNTYTYVISNSGSYSNVTANVGTLSIEKRTVTLTSETAEKPYDGTPLTKPDVTVGGEGFVEGEVSDIKATGSVTTVAEGEVTNTITYTEGANFKAGNYTITKSEGTLKITASTDKVTVTITENSGSEKYDGTEKTVTGYKVTSISNNLYKESDFTFSGNATVKGTDAGSYNMELKAADFTNTSTNFTNVEFVIVDGTLAISKRSVTLTSATDSKTYDAKPLTNDEVTVGGDGFANGEGAAYDVTGTQTLVGSSTNTFTYTLNEGTKAANYEISKSEGTLTVTDGTGDDEEPVDDGLIVTKAASDGTPKLGEEVTFTITATNIYDEPKTITLSEIEGVTLAQSSFENVEAGATVETTATYTITEADILNGKFVNTVTAVVGNLKKTATASVTPEKPNGHLTVDKETTSTPENGESYALGEEITYKITVTNDGNLTITGITVTDELTGDEWTIDSLKPGDSKEFTASYTVTEDDILAGEVLNIATAKGKSPDPEKPDVPVDPGEDPEPTEDPNAHVTIEKSVTSQPAENDKYKAGEIITYEITVTNDGNMTITDLKVTDELTGDEWTIDSLAPDDSKVFTTEYEVTEADAEKGSVKNTATATGKDPEGNDPEVVPGEVESETEPEVIEYKFTKGDGQTWMKSSNKTADFEVTRNIHDELAFGLYLDIEIDGKKVDKSQYKYEEGCVELYISADYMETLALGEHTIKALFEDGEAEAKFLVAKEETPAPPAPTPNTGDTTDIALWGALMTISNLGIAGITMLLKKKEDEE